MKEKTSTNITALQANDGSEFNNAFAALERMHNSLILANTMRVREDWDSMRIWLRALQMLDAELSSSYNDADHERMKKARVQSILKHSSNTKENERIKLNRYEIELRFIHTKKGFNLKTKEYGGSVLENDNG